MKRFLFVAVAALAAVLFTACPDKPKDGPVVIPDGTYKETAEWKWVRIYNGDTVDKDYILSDAVVDIHDGNFDYHPCDSVPLFYPRKYYCETGLYPAKMSPNGYVTLDSMASYYYDPIPVHTFGNGYKFSYSYKLPKDSPNANPYRINSYSHTLIPLTD